MNRRGEHIIDLVYETNAVEVILATIKAVLVPVVVTEVLVQMQKTYPFTVASFFVMSSTSHVTNIAIIFIFGWRFEVDISVLLL